MQVQTFHPAKKPKANKERAKLNKRRKLSLKDRYDALKALRRAVRLAEQNRNRTRQ
jgi:hypothetical protein